MKVALKIFLLSFILIGCSKHTLDSGKNVLHQVSRAKKLYFPQNKEELIELLKDVNIPLESIDVTKINDMSYLFSDTYGRENLEGLDQWDVRATNMKFMFSNSKIKKYPQWYLDYILKNPTFTPKNRKELNKIMKDSRVNNVEIDVSNIKDFSGLFDTLFYGFSNYAGVEYWDMRNAEDLSDMFARCGDDIPEGIKNWKLPNVKTMKNMFLNSKIKEYPEWYVDFVKKYPSYRPKDKEELLKILNHTKTFGIPSLSFRVRDVSLIEIDVSNLKDLSYVFCVSEGLKECKNELVDFHGIEYWDVGNVENMERIFMGSEINVDLSFWNVSNVKNFYEAFAKTPFNQDISNWKIQKNANIKDVFLNSVLEKEGRIPAWAK